MNVNFQLLDGPENGEAYTYTTSRHRYFSYDDYFIGFSSYCDFIGEKVKNQH